MKNVEKSTIKIQKICIVSSKAPSPIIKRLESFGYQIILLPILKGLNSKEGHHADMQLCRVSGKEIVYAPGVNPDILNAIEKRGFILIEGNTVLQRRYPDNIAYNVLVADTIFFHNTKYTDSTLIKKMRDRGLTPVLTKQGYAACSSCAISTKSGKTIILTGDLGIEKVCQENKIEVMFCRGAENIRLLGYNHGFVGGCCGRDDDILYTCGSIEQTFSNGYEIIQRLDDSGIHVVNLWGGRLRDVGGMLIL